MPYTEQTTLAAAKRDGRKYYFMICDMSSGALRYLSRIRQSIATHFCALSAKEARYKPFHLHPMKSTIFPIERVLVRVSLVDILVKRSHRHQTSIVSE